MCRVGFAYLVALSKLLPRRLRECADRGFRATAVAVFRVKGGGWTNLPQAFVVWARVPARSCIWPVPPFRISGCRHMSRALWLLSAEACRRCVACIPVQEGEVLASFGYGTAHPDARGDRAGAHWVLEVAVGREESTAQIVDACEVLGPPLRGFAVVLYGACLTPKLLVREGFVVSSLLPFEDTDTGGQLYFFVLYRRRGDAASAFAFPVRDFVASSPSPPESAAEEPPAKRQK